VMTTRDGRIDWARFYLNPVPPTVLPGAPSGG
jgi:hypothetical protein